MIIIPQVPSTLLVREWFAGEDSIEAIKLNISDLFDCKKFIYPSCNCLPVVASLTTTDEEVNDYTRFIYEVGGSYTLVATLIESDGTEHIITDNTYGDYYSTGTLKSGVWGFKLDWNNVANALGFGTYSFNVNIDNAFSRGDFNETFCYQLMPFGCDTVDGTVRITSEKNGYIENGFDYRNLSVGDWVDQIRIYGSFKFDEYTTTIDNIKLSDRSLQQIQTEIVDNFVLTLKGINSTVTKSFIKDSLLANRTYIDDYNRDNVNTYKKQYVSLLSIEKPIQAEINGTIMHTIKLTELTQSTLKRNF